LAVVGVATMLVPAGRRLKVKTSQISRSLVHYALAR